jgi:hypothetical protein
MLGGEPFLTPPVPLIHPGDVELLRLCGRGLIMAGIQLSGATVAQVPGFEQAVDGLIQGIQILGK